MARATRETHSGKDKPFVPLQPRLTVDVTLFTVSNLERKPELAVVLILRNEPPFEGRWALPGGFVLQGEDLETAARRVSRWETGIVEELEQVGAVGTVDRDPRSRVVTVVYAALVPSDRHLLWASGGAAGEARWFPVADRPPLAFDHDALLDQALDYLRRHLPESAACFRLLPEHFTLGELHRLYEAVLGLEGERRLDRANFRRRLLAREATGKRSLAFLEEVLAKKPARRQPAQLYRFLPEAFKLYVAERQRSPF
jgi:8-oxo-dGTP diphosphatase